MYRVGDPALHEIGRPSTLAKWRTTGEGPDFVRLGKRIGYSGRSLNEWIERRTTKQHVAG
ncbi:MAG: MerR family transcriptional regulator [Nitrospira sp. SB0662_bin_26]|nr:MerR family transcriptional regulator [Nitrospira sp. SB0662_bin_26]